MNIDDTVQIIIKFGFYIGSFMYGSFWIFGIAVNSGFSLFEHITKK